MSKIRKFKCDWEVKLFIQSRVLKELGSGSEGSCYDGRDGKVYKFLDFDTSAPYIIDEIITEEEVKSESFAFPEELYVVDETLRGYRTRKVKRDLFGEDNIFDLSKIVDIDFAAVANAYRKMLEDIKLLSEEKVLIFDLPFNIMFDGESYTGIDTCGYKRVGYNPLEENTKSLNSAMENLFKIWFMNYKEIEHRIVGTDIDEYLHRIMGEIPTDISMDRFFKVIENDVNQEKVKH